MSLWERAGKPDDLSPSRSDRGERRLLSAVRDVKQALALGEEITVIIDDRNGVMRPGPSARISSC